VAATVAINKEKKAKREERRKQNLGGINDEAQAAADMALNLQRLLRMSSDIENVNNFGGDVDGVNSIETLEAVAKTVPCSRFGCLSPLRIPKHRRHRRQVWGVH